MPSGNLIPQRRTERATSNKAVPQKELKSERYGFKLEPSEAVEFETFAAQNKKTLQSIIEEGIQRVIRGAKVTDTGLEGAPMLEVNVACGPASEAREDATIYAVSKQTADELQLDQTKGDFFVRARGQSMEGAGIYEEFVVLFSPLPPGRQPRKGQIALVSFLSEHGDCTGTLKRWDGIEPDGTPRLLDGEKQAFTIPENTVRATAVATAKGVIGSLIF